MNSLENQRTSHQVVLGALLALLSYLAVATMGTLVKFVPPHVPMSLILFAQYIVGFIIVAFLATQQPKRFLLTQKPLLYTVRIASGVASFGLFFISLKYINLVNSIVLRSTTPFWIPLILFAWKRQKISLALWCSIVIGFIGVLCIIKPSFATFNIGMLYALLSGMTMGIAALSIRRLNRTEPNLRALFYYFGVSSLLFLPFFLEHISSIQSFKLFFLLLGIGLCMFIVQYGLIKAFNVAKTSTLAPIAYTAILFSGIYDWFIWHIIPDTISFIGIALIVIGALIILWIKEKEVITLNT